MIDQFSPVTDGILTLVKEWEPRLTDFPEDMITHRKNSQDYPREDWHTLISLWKYRDSWLWKLYKETDSESMHLTRILIEITGLAKKRNGRLSLTAAAKKYLSDDSELLKLIFSKGWSP